SAHTCSRLKFVRGQNKQCAPFLTFLAMTGAEDQCEWERALDVSITNFGKCGKQSQFLRCQFDGGGAQFGCVSGARAGTSGPVFTPLARSRRLNVSNMRNHPSLVLRSCRITTGSRRRAGGVLGVGRGPREVSFWGAYALQLIMLAVI